MAFEVDGVVADSWADAQEHLFANSWNPTLNRYRPSFAFRGLARERYGLPTSLNRLGGRNKDDLFDCEFGAKVESDLLRNFIKYAPEEGLSDESVWHQLSVAQHHGLPTRILDWTYSPLVALHFATANLDALDENGVVWVVDIDDVHNRLPGDVRAELEGHVFTVDELAELSPTLEDLEERFSGPQTNPQPLFFEPPSLDDRIVNQFALFSVMPFAALRFDEWLEDHSDVYKRVVIPSDVKMEIRDKLDASNITERMLFPGLDGLADWLERYYSPVD